MDWIEELFRISPDGGNGMLELAFLAVIAIALVLVALLIRRNVRRRVPR